MLRDERIGTALRAPTDSAARKTPGTAPAAAFSPFPYLAPEQRPRKAREALDEKTDKKARFHAVWGLAISGYTRQGAEALSVIASDSRYETTTRVYAAMGLRNFTSSMPDDVRRAIQDTLHGALEAEKCRLPDGVMRTLIAWGGADRIRKVLGDKLRGHRMEVEVLQCIRSRDEAVTRLLELYQAAPAVTSEVGWSKRWQIGAALIHRKDKRGIDVLLECLTVKEPWSIDSPSPRAKRLAAASFRQSLHNTFARISGTIDEDFGYEGGGTWTPQLDEAIDKLVQWWEAHRDTWSFEEATSDVVPTIEPGKPFTKRKARVLAAKLANEAFAKRTFKHANGRPVGKIQITAESFNHVRQEQGRWVLRMIRSRGPEAFVDFALDGSDAKVIVNYAWR
jgi:hypothetical protein